jgi:imidazolonepropionase
MTRSRCGQDPGRDCWSSDEHRVVDSHTHLVFAGDRAEFAARMAGAPYGAGGIGSTVSTAREASTDELRRLADRTTHA